MWPPAYFHKRQTIWMYSRRPIQRTFTRYTDLKSAKIFFWCVPQNGNYFNLVTAPYKLQTRFYDFRFEFHLFCLWWSLPMDGCHAQRHAHPRNTSLNFSLSLLSKVSILNWEKTKKKKNNEFQQQQQQRKKAETKTLLNRRKRHMCGTPKDRHTMEWIHAGLNGWDHHLWI